MIDTMTCFGWLEVDLDETYVYILVNQNTNGYPGIVSVKDINTDSPSIKYEYFQDLVWLHRQCNIALGNNSNEVFIATKQDGCDKALVCKYI